jgi:hypothetical protein
MKLVMELLFAILILISATVAQQTLKIRIYVNIFMSCQIVKY